MENKERSQTQSEWKSLECPFCHSLFRVNKADLLPIDHYSFSCLSCKHIFWAGLNKDKIDVWTFKPNPDKQEKLILEEKICPHCFSSMKKGVLECLQCGQSFYNTQWMQKAPHASFQLRKLFEDLLSSYSSSEKHGEFVSQCLKESNSIFGLYCYKHLMESRPKDQKTKKMFQYLKSVSTPKVIKKSFQKVSNDYLTGWFHALVLCIVLILISILVI